MTRVSNGAEGTGRRGGELREQAGVGNPMLVPESNAGASLNTQSAAVDPQSAARKTAFASLWWSDAEKEKLRQQVISGKSPDKRERERERENRERE